jgi:hypothetical protein
MITTKERVVEESAASDGAPTITGVSTSRKVLITLAAVLSMIFMMESAARSIVAVGRPRMFGGYEIDAKKQIAEQSGKDGLPRLFFLGTSFTSHGIYTDLITDKLQRAGFSVSAYNLAHNGSYAADQLLMLRSALRNEYNSPPSAVVFEVSPLMLAALPGTENAYSQPVLTSYEGGPLLERKPGIAGDIIFALASQSFLIRYRPYLLKQLHAIPSYVCATLSAVTRNIEPAVVREVSPNGWSPAYWLVRDPKQIAKSICERDARMKELFPVGDTGRVKLSFTSIGCISQECQTRHIPLVLAWLPMHPDYLSVCCNKLALNEEELGAAMRHFAEVSHAEFLDVHNDRDLRHFHDCDHLNVLGSIDVSNRISEAFATRPLSEYLTRSRTK